MARNGALPLTLNERKEMINRYTKGKQPVTVIAIEMSRSRGAVVETLRKAKVYKKSKPTGRANLITAKERREIWRLRNTENLSIRAIARGIRRSYGGVQSVLKENTAEGNVGG